MGFQGGRDGHEETRFQRPDSKEEALRAARALSPRPQTVVASEFAISEFFDARDLVQVKHETLRRARQVGSTVTDAAAAFGFSRPSFYEAKAAFEQAGILPACCPSDQGRGAPTSCQWRSSSDVERH